jgi:hypothetical protein
MLGKSSRHLKYIIPHDPRQSLGTKVAETMDWRDAMQISAKTVRGKSIVKELAWQLASCHASSYSCDMLSGPTRIQSRCKDTCLI